MPVGRYEAQGQGTDKPSHNARCNVKHGVPETHQGCRELGSSYIHKQFKFHNDSMKECEGFATCIPRKQQPELEESVGIPKPARYGPTEKRKLGSYLKFLNLQEREMRRAKCL